MVEVGSLEPVPIRDVWPDEAKDLTPWLSERSDLVGEALGMELELEGIEVPVGPFSADLLFRDVSTDSLVVVENMISPTDHDHLGKLITYSAGLEVQYAVLLAERFRPEHRSALTWLNAVSSEGFGFFGLSLEVWRIGDSPPAPRLRVDVQPDDWTRTVKATSSHALTPNQQAYIEFWDGFLAEFHERFAGWSRASTPPKHQWMGFPSAIREVRFNSAFCRPDGEYRLRAEAYIDSPDEEVVAEIFESLLAARDNIEEVTGPLDWDALEDKRAARVSLYYPDPIRVAERDRWPEAREWLLNAMGLMREAFNSHLGNLL